MRGMIVRGGGAGGGQGGKHGGLLSHSSSNLTGSLISSTCAEIKNQTSESAVHTHGKKKTARTEIVL